MALLLLT